MFKIAVLVSGGGTDLQSILDAIETGTLTDCEVSYIVADRNCPALDRARKYKIPFLYFEKRGFTFIFSRKRNRLNSIGGIFIYFTKQFFTKLGEKDYQYPSLFTS